VDAKQAEVFDWMGNGKLVPTRSGRLAVMIGPEPIYVKMTPRLPARRAGRIPRR